MAERLRFETKPNLKGDVFILQESTRDFVESLPSQLYAGSIEVNLSPGNNIVPHRFNSVPNGYFRIYQSKTNNLQGVTGTTINNGGSFSSDGVYPAQQLSTSGTGIESEFNVTILGGVVTKVEITANGSGYNVNDTITLTGIPSQITACIVNVSEVDNGYSKIYDYQKPDRNNLYLNSSAATTIKIVVV
jgi:hypothetical protein